MLGASVAIAVLWRQMFEVDGLVNQVLRLFGIPATTSWIGDPQYALWTIILLHVWTFGSPMVIFLAGLRQIPGMYYEAASVDGASRWNQFRRITLPLLSPIIFFNLVLHALPLPARVRPVPDGLCRRDGLAAGGDHRGFHGSQLLLLQALGVLR
jgi:multiple sugar transport system permease protein